MDKPIDTRVMILDFKAGQIGGIIAPWSDAQHKSRAVAHNVESYDGYYLTPETMILVPSDGSGVWIYGGHHYELGAIGYCNLIAAGPDGIAITATLMDSAATLCFDRPGRLLPKLLQAGKLYWCADFADPDIAPDGFLRSAKLVSLNLTEHPGVPKAVLQ